MNARCSAVWRASAGDQHEYVAHPEGKREKSEGDAVIRLWI